jgi:hypothetical protein
MVGLWLGADDFACCLCCDRAKPADVAGLVGAFESGHRDMDIDKTSATPGRQFAEQQVSSDVSPQLVMGAPGAVLLLQGDHVAVHPPSNRSGITELDSEEM